jgi:hypothetical protein
MVKKAVQRGRSKREGEAYSFPYVEPLNVARTKLADFFNILLEKKYRAYVNWQSGDGIMTGQTAEHERLSSC